MSSFISNENIKSSITEETYKLNKCVKEWYKTNLESDDLQEFQGCCNEDEINLLIRCYNIFSEKKKLESLDKDFIRALVAYYYNLIVFENYMHEFIGEKYLKIVDEYPSKVPNNKIFTDNNDNIYAYYWNKYDNEENYIEVKDEINRKKYYVSNKDRKADPYFYQDKEGKIIVVLQQHMNCLENILDTENSKEYYKLLYKNDEDWISQIRRIILNMNSEPFEGHKGGKKGMKKKNTTKKNTTKKNKRKKNRKSM
jgi:hypothetical protein